MKHKKLKLLLTGILLIFIVSFSYTKYHNMNINDIGLKILSLVKKVKGSAVNIEQIGKSNTPNINHHHWDELLRKNVTDNGNVNYKGFISDKSLFQNYLDDLSAHTPGNNWSKEESLAYWINAYNAFTVKLIVDNYPLASIKDISDGLPMVNSPWDIKFFKLGKVDFDLNTIEHEILRKQFEEPRIHFAINCASVSCPLLRNEAYKAQDIEMQLAEQAIAFVNDIDRNVINKNETKLSKIFNWFESDFTKKISLISYIEKYNPAINENNSIEFLEYDWSLNE